MLAGGDCTPQILAPRHRCPFLGEAGHGFRENVSGSSPRWPPPIAPAVRSASPRNSALRWVQLPPRRSASRVELLLLLEDTLHLGVVAGDTAAQEERVRGGAPGPAKVVQLQPLACLFDWYALAHQ